MPLCLCLLSSCAYYNGMYSANKYSRDAQRSERAGRLSEARERWARAAVHAESVVARHPTSRWADDAHLVRGRALVHLESHSDAVPILEIAARVAGTREQKLEALLLLGRANLALRRPGFAEAALDSAALSAVPARRDVALLLRGRLRMLRGDPAGALDDFLVSDDPRALPASAAAALALGDTVRAAGYLDRLAQEPYDETAWLPLLDSLAQAGGSLHAAALVDRLAGRRGADMGVAERARLLIGDGARHDGHGDTAAAAARYRAAARAAPDSIEARAAAVRLARLALRAASDSTAIADVTARLAQVSRMGGSPARDSDEMLYRLGRLERLGAAEPESTAAVRWFARAELARDSLGMQQWAAAQFAAMADRFPDSPWTPKGVVAAIAGGHPDDAALDALLRGRYAASPYAVVALGGDSPRYGVLEDSLRVLLASAAPLDDEPLRRPGMQPRPTQPRPLEPRPVDPRP